MRDRNYFDDEYDRGRYGRSRTPSSREYSPREHSSREGYNIPSTREGREYYREGYEDRTAAFDRYSTGYDPYESRDRYESRYEPRYQPRYEPRYEPRYTEHVERGEYAERDRTKFTNQTRSQLRCRDIMTRDVATARRDTSLREIARMMRDEDTGAIPVIDEENRVIGIITDRDIVVRILADRDLTLENATVNDAMTDKVYSVSPNDRLVDAIRKMGDKQVRRILVTDDRDHLKGIISMGDVATEAEYDGELQEALEDISKPKSWLRRIFS